MKNNSPHRISTEVTTEKIKIMNDIDLNALQNQIDDLYGTNDDKDKRIHALEKEVKYLKETYVTKTDLKKTETDIVTHISHINHTKRAMSILSWLFFCQISELCFHLRRQRLGSYLQL